MRCLRVPVRPSPGSTGTALPSTSRAFKCGGRFYRTVSKTGGRNTDPLEGVAELMVTRDELEKARTARGGYTREQLKKWGVPWPPPKGWKKALLAAEPEQDVAGP